MTVEDITVPGSPPVRVRRYQPLPANEPEPRTVVWFHGGGFIGGSLDMPESDLPCRAFAAAGVTAVTVDYRLAPGPGPRARRRPNPHRFPMPLDDGEAAWNWVAQQAPADGRLFVGGASAGGTLAGTLTLRLRRRGVRGPDGVVLAYPLLHAELPPLPPAVRHSVRGLRRLGTFTPGAVRWMSRNYVGPDGLDRLSEAFPVVDEPDGFPPTLIVDSECDTLRASSIAFAEALGRHGVPVTHLVEPGTRHGHLNRDDAAGNSTAQRMAAWIRDFS